MIPLDVSLPGAVAVYAAALGVGILLGEIECRVKARRRRREDDRHP